MAETTTEFELADATRVRGLETNILHASDVIYWLDGSSADNLADMSRIAHPLDLMITQKPSAIKMFNSAGKTAFWPMPVQAMLDGVTTDIQRQRSLVEPFVIAGIVSDNRGRFNPAAFSLTLGSGNGGAVKLFPAPAAVRVTVGGAILGHVAFANNNAPLAWGLLTLTVNLDLGETVRFQGQTDGKGDFVIALKHLPPLPLSVTEYTAILTLQGLASATASAPVNINDVQPLQLESASVQNDFVSSVALAIRPGESQRITSFNKSFIAVQTA